MIGMKVKLVLPVFGWLSGFLRLPEICHLHSSNRNTCNTPILDCIHTSWTSASPVVQVVLVWASKMPNLARVSSIESSNDFWIFREKTASSLFTTITTVVQPSYSIYTRYWYTVKSWSWWWWILFVIIILWLFLVSTQFKVPSIPFLRRIPLICSTFSDCSRKWFQSSLMTLYYLPIGLERA